MPRLRKWWLASLVLPAAACTKPAQKAAEPPSDAAAAAPAGPQAIVTVIYRLPKDTAAFERRNQGGAARSKLEVTGLLHGRRQKPAEKLRRRRFVPGRIDGVEGEEPARQIERGGLRASGSHRTWKVIVAQLET